MQKKQILITNNSKDGKIDFVVKYKNYESEEEVAYDVMLSLTKLFLEFCGNNPNEAIHNFNVSLSAFSDVFIEDESEGKA